MWKPGVVQYMSPEAPIPESITMLVIGWRRFDSE
jgi:hypothetical protein